MAQLDLAHGSLRGRAAPGVAEGAPRLRVWAIGLLGVFVIVMGLGSTWDVKWHYAIGRDSFWIPPHLLLYLSVALNGLLCAGVVLYETWRDRMARRRSGEGDDGMAAEAGETFHVLGFSGPLGLFIGGGGGSGLL